MRLMKLATANRTDDLASDVARLTVALTEAERACVNPADAVIAGLRSQLVEKQRELTAIEESEAADVRRRDAANTLYLAEQEHVQAESELSRLVELRRSLRDAISRAQGRFAAALAALALAKSNVERNER